MAKHSIIDPVDRIEGHLRVEMEVENGVVTDAWVSGGLFRGLELIVEGRDPYDAAMLAQRVCGVCPVSHCHTSVYAAEEAYGIQIPEGGRLVRNLIEGAQFMHSHILWFYQLSALDYVNPLHALEADINKTYELCQTLGLAQTDFAALKDRLAKFAANGQYSWLSGGWFMEGLAPEAYKLPAEVDLIATAHYIEALDMQATADEISAIIGGKMPHVQTSIPGGTAWYPSVEKLDDVLFRAKKLKDWVDNVMIPGRHRHRERLPQRCRDHRQQQARQLHGLRRLRPPVSRARRPLLPRGHRPHGAAAHLFSSNSTVRTSPRTRCTPTTQATRSRCIPRSA